MSNSITETLENHQNRNNENTQEWETLARAWLSTLPKDKSLNLSDVVSWLESNSTSLPEHVKSMPQSEIYKRFTSIWNDLEPFNEEKEANQIDHSQARFTRTDQWMPVYAWLESLDTDEVIKSQEILDWLTANPQVREDLYTRHSRYHLMHYIKKCHAKILKRKERKKGLLITNKTSSPRVHKHDDKKPPVPLPGSNVINLPKDSPLYLVKRNEAFRKFEILIEMENQLSTLFPKDEAAKILEGS